MDIKALYEKYRESGSVSSDTRTIVPGSVFFSLKGPHFNGNEFAQEALTKGAHYAVVDEERFAQDPRCILVEDGLKALQELARFHRSQLKIPVIGLTGSNGKTTTKELVTAVLSKKFKTLPTKGNLNNHIGVPLTILRIDRTVEIAVIEMGANHVGEIASLCAICNPTHGFITNIGKAHLGTFGGLENIIQGKSELYQHLLTSGGTVFINSQNPVLTNMARRFKEPVFYPGQGDYYHCEQVMDGPWLTLQAENGERIKTRMIGAYNFENAAVALTIGKYFGVEASQANQAVADYEPGNMRSQVISKGTNTIILDAYNANPSSMEAAIENLATLAATRKIVILGDMYELEGMAEEEHQRIGTLLREKGIQEAYLCGPLMKSAELTYREGKYFPSKKELMEALKKHPLAGATILVKGSRGMKMEELVDAL